MGREQMKVSIHREEEDTHATFENAWRTPCTDQTSRRASLFFHMRETSTAQFDTKFIARQSWRGGNSHLHNINTSKKLVALQFAPLYSNIPEQEELHSLFSLADTNQLLFSNPTHASPQRLT